RAAAGLRLPPCLRLGQAAEHGHQPRRADPLRHQGPRVVALRGEPGGRQRRRQPAGHAPRAQAWGGLRAPRLHLRGQRADPEDRLRRLPALTRRPIMAAWTTSFDRPWRSGPTCRIATAGWGWTTAATGTC